MRKTTQRKPKIVAILGPTASGKSDLAVMLAKKFHGEIISADSRQVYRGLDIGSGKITKRDMRGIPHHLLDVANPQKRFSVSDYQRLATDALHKIIEKRRLPIVVGGSGMYIDTLLKDVSYPNVPPNPSLRDKLEKRDTTSLFKTLKESDPLRAQSVDRHNKRRLVRALEIVNALGNVPRLKEKESPYTTLWIGLSPKERELRLNIQKRLHSRMKRGMFLEARRLHQSGVSFRRMRELGLEYGLLADLLHSRLTKDEFLATLENKIWQYAKRQMTWFKRDKNIHWFSDPASPRIIKLVEDFLSTS